MRDSRADSGYKRIGDRRKFFRSAVKDWKLDPLQYSITDLNKI